MFLEDYITILFGAVLAQSIMQGSTLELGLVRFFNRHTHWEESTIIKIGDSIIPILGALIVFLIVHPDGIIPQMTSGLTCNATIMAFIKNASAKDV